MEDKNNKNKNFFDSLEEDLKKDLKDLDTENKNKFEALKVEIAKLIQEKLENFYYWLLGSFLILLIIIFGGIFYLRNLSTSK